ncbi:MAG TPA: HEXXH motif-containing putative peptide modification protein [Nitrospira sp.]|nr:HEXXH motif-containing putative peptide modification protein [Nitrospira sp.]
MTVLDARILERLMEELQQSMRGLLKDVCRDFTRNYAEATRTFALPIDWFLSLGQSLTQAEYSNWKVVGWIESLNDLLYFVDIVAQVRQERSRGDIAEQLRAEFREKFYEHGYADEIFPRGKPEPRLLLGRLTALCRRLAREITQESVCLAPRLACTWVAQQRQSAWVVPCDLTANVERVELPWGCAVGTAGLFYEATGAVRTALQRAEGQGEFLITASGIELLVGDRAYPMMKCGGQERWQWRRLDPLPLRKSRYGALVLGPTLVYGKDKTPVGVRPTKAEIATRMRRALVTIAAAWPEGDRLLALLTSRIVPLRAKGVVSFSYRHRPGLSAINCFDRDQLDLIDDLIHENSHHHLNLLLRKDVMYQHDHNQEIFYSPWRRTLRPLRGILHATFTFTMGAMLFERLVVWGSSKGGKAGWKKAGLNQRDLYRARYRCLEEIESVRYSLKDLEYAGRHLKWLSGGGKRLVKHLRDALVSIEQGMQACEQPVSESAFGPALRRHRTELAQARETLSLM